MTLRPAGAVLLDQIATPATPAASKSLLYVKSDGKIYTKDPAGNERLSSNVDVRSVNDRPTAGWDSMERDSCNQYWFAGVSGSMRLRYFTAQAAGTSTQYSWSMLAQAGYTFTLCQTALFTIDGSGNGTQVATHTSDTAMVTTTQIYTKSWTSSYAMVLGQRYAIGTLFVYSGSGTALPAMVGNAAEGATQALAPRLTGYLSSLAAMPSSFTAGSVGTVGNSHWYRLS